MLTFHDIHAAAARLRDHVLQTPCVASQTLSEITGAQVYLKFENLQFTASFKERGACNRLTLLTDEERQCLNAYHQMVYDRLSPMLDEEEKKWLEEKTKRI